MAIDRNVHEISLRSLVSLTVSNNVIKTKISVIFLNIVKIIVLVSVGLYITIIVL